MLRKEKTRKLFASLRLKIHSHSQIPLKSPNSKMCLELISHRSNQKKNTNRHLKLITHIQKENRPQNKSKPRMHTLRLKPKTKNVYECFSQRDQNNIHQALDILRVREEKKEKEEQNKIFPNDKVKEQVIKNKNIFLMGLTTRSIKQKELRLKTNQANKRNILNRFQNQIKTLDQSSNSKFQTKMQIVDKTITSCTTTVYKNYEVLKNVRERGD